MRSLEQVALTGLQASKRRIVRTDNEPLRFRTDRIDREVLIGSPACDVDNGVVCLSRNVQN
jgi:hypothetical protein